MNHLSDELENQKAQLNNTCRIAHYNQEGVDHLFFRMESEKKLLIGINKRFPECRNNQNLAFPIEKLDYAIKNHTKESSVYRL